MKSAEEIKAQIELYRRERSYADHRVEVTEGQGAPAAYWEHRVAELTRVIWELEWVMS
ncbi:hypothetical protein [Leucobacter sp. NPDC077196]|uniref:hypothetical protein n=1 Tax=Leucobacter sp. NPDC077196 TaxID=3154959 RepID=UPI0034175501